MYAVAETDHALAEDPSLGRYIARRGDDAAPTGPAVGTGAAGRSIVELTAALRRGACNVGVSDWVRLFCIGMAHE